MNGIAISGKAGAGKNRLADELSIRLVNRGLWPVECGFAEGPKAELFAATGLRKEDPGGRAALVHLAHTRRGECVDYWVEKFNKKAVSLIASGCVPIVTDLRYENELVWARASGFLVVRVDATRADRMAALARRGEEADFADSDHPSECELDEGSFDFRFWNEHYDETYNLGRWAYRIVEAFLGEADRTVLSGKRGEGREALPTGAFEKLVARIAS